MGKKYLKKKTKKQKKSTKPTKKRNSVEKYCFEKTISKL